MPNAAIVYLPVVQLIPAPRNARRHSRKQIQKLARIIGEFGFLVPLLVTQDGRIIAGHGRAEAAKLLSMTHVPVIYVDHLTPAQIEALALAENRIGDESRFSADDVQLIMQDLAAIGDFDLRTTGFDTAEIDLMLIEPDAEPEEEPEPSRDGPALSKVGDLFEIGEHRIMCGDALDPATFERLMAGKLARASIDDFPFNLPVNGYVSGTGRHAEFPMASGEMSSAEFTAFINSVSQLLVAHSLPGSLHYLFMDHRHLRELLDGAEPAFSQLLNLCVWVKRNAGLGSFYRSRHELIFVFKAGSAPHINNVELGKHGRSRSNVWEYAGANSFGKARDRMLAQHPTSKNVGMIADAILDCTDRGDLVLDSFLGSGTTLVACEQTGRRCRGIELDPHYVDLVIARAERLTGKPAVHIASGKTFAELIHMRLNPGWGMVA